MIITACLTFLLGIKLELLMRDEYEIVTVVESLVITAALVYQLA